MVYISCGTIRRGKLKREKLAMKNFSRRTFLGTAPVAAAAGLTLANTSMLSVFAASHDAQPALPAPFSVQIQVEKATSAKEFEWHEGRDHVFQVLDGSTVYELGGTPKGGHSKGPGEWLAPESEGATSIALKKGDLLVIPRGTPHKRSTAESVTLLLISPMGTLKP
jgi:mannose-6-phosphate isomerase-like protein (cupin superfamily)